MKAAIVTVQQVGNGLAKVTARGGALRTLGALVGLDAVVLPVPGRDPQTKRERLWAALYIAVTAAADLELYTIAVDAYGVPELHVMHGADLLRWADEQELAVVREDRGTGAYPIALTVTIDGVRLVSICTRTEADRLQGIEPEAAPLPTPSSSDDDGMPF